MSYIAPKNMDEAHEQAMTMVERISYLEHGISSGMSREQLLAKAHCTALRTIPDVTSISGAPELIQSIIDRRFAEDAIPRSAAFRQGFEDALRTAGVHPPHAMGHPETDAYLSGHEHAQSALQIVIDTLKEIIF